MIIDSIKNLKKYEILHDGFKKVNNFLLTHDLKTLDCGKYQIDSDNVYLSVQSYMTKAQSDANPEIHRNYIDIQIVICGEEKIGYANSSSLEKDIPYNKETDLEFLKGEVEFFKATNKNFFIFYPQDAHMPSISIEKTCEVKKAVFKIKLEN